jgi:phosphoribosylglycinamide formyltransferase 2
MRSGRHSDVIIPKKLLLANNRFHLTFMKKKIMLLGSGELGRELVISLQRLGQYVIAVDNYPDAPAMQVANEYEVVNMLDGAALDSIVEKHRPDLIVPEVEAIRTERFYDYERSGITVVPSARAANFTMNRKQIRDLAAKENGLRTARYAYATTPESFMAAVKQIGLPCVVKPLMSSSGKGQSVVRNEAGILKAWDYAMQGSRGDYKEVIAEEFIPFDFEITVLTVTQKSGQTLFCPPIGHRQERGDYQESWQPCAISETQFAEACDMAGKITAALGGAGIWGVEFFVKGEAVYFSELSPRPHDTGMVTLAGTQNLNEFELHARAILGLPITEVTLERSGASAVILASDEGPRPEFSGIEKALSIKNSDVRLFNKPVTRPYRRMAVALSYDHPQADINSVKARAVEIASHIKVSASG